MVVGAGAIGGVVGGLLHRSGADVQLVARGAHLTAIQQHGLRLLTEQGDTVEQLPAVGSVAEIRWAAGDVVLLAVKSDATPAVLAELAILAPPSVRLVCLQNGVANEPTALRFFEHVYGVCVMCPASHLEPGEVEANCGPVSAILDIGRFPTGIDDTTERVAAAFRAAGMVSEPRSDIMRWKYRKLISNLGNAANALLVPGPEADDLMRRVRLEGEQVLAAAGIDVLPAAEDEVRRGDILQSYPRPGRRRGGSSSWQSLARRTGTIESDYLNGEIVLLARSIGHPAPVNTLLRLLAVRIAADRAAPGTVDAAEVLDQLPGE